MVTTLPISTDSPVTVNIVTSKMCRMCNNVTDAFVKRLSPIRNLVQTKMIDIDQSPSNVPKDVLSLPSISIGEHKIDAQASDRDLVQTIQHYLKEEKTESPVSSQSSL